jgi:hypothetical protein
MSNVMSSNVGGRGNNNNNNTNNNINVFKGFIGAAATVHAQRVSARLQPLEVLILLL